MENKLPVTENTLFAIGSCTKAFTASMLGMLEKDGKVDLNKPARNYLPELKFYNEYLNGHVTLTDMMCHRTGLPRHDLSWYGSNASRTDLLKRIEFLEPSAELREKWQYNNFMFMTQGIVVEKITGKSWEDNMKEKILTPLGMINTDLSVLDMEKSENHSLAYSLKNDSIIHAIPYSNIDAIGPAGSVNSCAKDMANWLITWINGGRFNGKEIIPVNYVTRAITVQMAMGGGLPDSANPDIHFAGYGLGWGVSSYRGHYRVEHGGGIDGFISSTSFFPSDSIGIFVVSDQGAPTACFRNFIADRMLKLSYRNWNKDLLDAAAKAKAAAAKSKVKNDSLNHKFNTKPSHAPSDYAGTYSNPGYGNIEIIVKDDSLYGKFNSFNLQLIHFHYDQFNTKILGEGFEDADPIRLSFSIDAKGDIDKFTASFESGVKDIEFKKELKPIALNKTDLDKYIGEYDISGVSIKIYTKNDSTLHMFVQGQPEYELVPTDKDKFIIKNLSGFSVQFNRNESGEVIELLSIQPNGTFKAIKKR